MAVCSFPTEKVYHKTLVLRHILTMLYAQVNVNPLPWGRAGNLAWKVACFDCKCVPDDRGHGRHFLVWYVMLGTKARK